MISCPPFRSEVKKEGRAQTTKIATTTNSHVAEPAMTPEQMPSESKVSWSKKYWNSVSILQKSREQIVLLCERCCTSWLMILLPFVPAGFIIYYLRVNPAAIFVINFVAVFPIALVNSKAMDLMIDQIGTVKGGLLYMTFGLDKLPFSTETISNNLSNIVQLITSILLLRSRQIDTLKTSLLGGIVSLLLLVTGACYTFGGVSNDRTGFVSGIEQDYNSTAVKMMGDLLTLISISILIPTASHILSGTSTKSVTLESRGSSVVLILVYGCWLVFQLKTHAYLFDPDHSYSLNENGETGENEKTPNVWGLSVLLVLTTTIIAFNTNFAIDSIDGLVKHTSVPKSFVGFILLPILNNDTTALSNGMKDKMDLALHSCIGKSLQITLLFVPMMVLIAWIMGIDEMNLLFDSFQVVTFVLTVVLITHITADGKSNW